MTVRRAIAALRRRLRRLRPPPRFDRWPGLLISSQPLVLLTLMAWERLPLLERMPRKFKRTPCHVFVVLSWTYRQEPRQQTLARWYHAYTAAHPHRRLTVLANEPEIVAPLRRHGVDIELINENVWLDEEIFRPRSEAVPEFDAVYNAKFAPWKRHELARNIERLALVGYPDQFASKRESARYLRHLREALPQATFCNDITNGTMRRLSPVEVNHVLSRARIGLCLSAEEGAMRASMEYLMSGLPVVSTSSLGGRDYFFDPEYCRVVEPDPGAIRAAVAELTALGIPRERVRERTLLRVEADRARFDALVNAALGKPGGAAGVDDQWRRRLSEFWPSRPVVSFWDRVQGSDRMAHEPAATAVSPASKG